MNRRVNEQIRLSPVRVIDETGTLLGELPTNVAMGKAREAGLDLVEVDPNSRPPVCKIMDYGKFRYRESKKKHLKPHEQKLKELRLRPKTDPHDQGIKVKHAKEFLSHGDKVQFTMVFRGRERAHAQVGMEIFNSIMADLDGVAKVERPPKMEGKRMTMILMPATVLPVKGGGGHPTAPPATAPKPAPPRPPSTPAPSRPS